MAESSSRVVLLNMASPYQLQGAGLCASHELAGVNIALYVGARTSGIIGNTPISGG